MKSTNYYKTHGFELEKSLLTVIPDAPRVPHSGLPAGCDWNMFNSKTNSPVGNVCNKCNN